MATTDLDTRIAAARETLAQKEAHAEDLKAEADRATKAYDASRPRDAKLLLAAQVARDNLKDALDDIETYRTTVLQPAEAAKMQARRERETAELLAAIETAQKACDAAGAAFVDSIAKLEASFATLRDFGARQAQSIAGVSLAPVMLRELLAHWNAQLATCKTADASIRYVNTGNPGLVELRVSMPAAIPSQLTWGL